MVACLITSVTPVSPHPGSYDVKCAAALQAEDKRQHKLDKLEQSREAMRVRIHKHIQQHAGTAQAADVKV